MQNIQQVSHKIEGLGGTLFGFGNILVYTGGGTTPFMIPNVPDPYDVQQEILRTAAGEGYIEAEEDEEESSEKD